MKSIVMNYKMLNLNLLFLSLLKYDDKNQLNYYLIMNEVKL